jgi:adenosylmethionine-8-amino-7-oxononanoate aminotransferase
VLQRRNALWLPFTPAEGFDAFRRTFVRGEGNYLCDERGGRVFDAVSSIWTTIHGHCHPYIVDAIARQAAELDHATLLGACNPRAEELSERLAALTGIPHVFFSSDGASAIEAALKMALHYWQHAGEPARRTFVHLRGSYHGDTSAAMSVSDIAAFKTRYGAVTFETRSYDDPAVLNREDVAAVIVEPIVQAAAGMRIVPLKRYAALRDCKPLLILDEIATGFGRTGSMFAFEQLDLTPDLLCAGKGLTGGALALSATLASERVFESFRGTYAENRHFLHGHSYAGNPIACAAALASLELFQRERTLEHAALVRDAVSGELQGLARHPAVREVRAAGSMIGIEIEAAAVDAHDAPTPAWRIAGDLYERGHFTRPIGEVIQLVPPLSSTAEELRSFLESLHDALPR